eukprot:2671931-Rhodomonas_salina.1
MKEQRTVSHRSPRNSPLCASGSTFSLVSNPSASSSASSVFSTSRARLNVSAQCVHLSSPPHVFGSCAVPPWLRTTTSQSSTHSISSPPIVLIFLITWASSVASTEPPCFDPKQGAAYQYSCPLQRMPK